MSASATIQSHRRSIRSIAVAYVESLDMSGAAVSRIERWLRRPTDEEWAEVHGPRSATTTLPETCSFTGGLPGERVEVELCWTLPRPGRKRARYAPAPRVVMLTVIDSSSDRVTPTCPVFGRCGGCQLQHLAYNRQLAWKTARVASALRTAGLSDFAVAPTIGCAGPWHYRNHMRFSVDRQGRPGLTMRNSHEILPLQNCPIAHPHINRVLSVLANHPNPRPQVLIRCGDATGQVLIQPEPESAIRSMLLTLGVDVHTEVLEERLQIPGLERSAASAAFRIRPSSFFQTNTMQANRMAELVLSALPTGSEVTLVDAYCGVGTFAALMAPHAGRVLAIEESASAVRDARWNLRNAPNVEVIQAKTEAVLPTLDERIDGLVIDPPRAGCQRPVLDALRTRRLPHIVYVSCEPSTLARDLAYLCAESGCYQIVGIQPLDMFPQTAHVETVAILESR